MRLLPALLVLMPLAGCAGYAIDYTRPKASIVAPELTRFGMDSAQSSCVAERLSGSLSVWQLRQLQIVAASVKRGYSDPARLTVSDLLWAARHAKDPKVGAEMAQAAGACGVAKTVIAEAAARPEPQAPVAAPPALQPAPAIPPPSAPPATVWINLGAAPTGQTIAVDASTLTEQGNFRSGWFRLASPGHSGPAQSAYLLRVDCTARTINAMAVRKHDAKGAVLETRDLGPNGEGATPVEDGTVMQIAFLSLCT